MNKPILPIIKLVRLVAQRIRFQRIVQGLVSGSAYAMILFILLLSLQHTKWISFHLFLTSSLLLLIIPVAWILYAATRPLDHISIAQRIDEAHNLHDRLSTALFLDQHPIRTAFSDAQLADALRSLDHIDVSRAAPFQRPSDLLPLALLAVVATSLSFFPLPQFQQPIPSPPAFINHQPILDSTTILLQKQYINKLKKQAESLPNPATKRLIASLEHLIQQAETRSISEREFLQKLKDIESELNSHAASQQHHDNQQTKDALAKAAEQLLKEHSSELEALPNFKKALEAFRQHDSKAASKALDTLAKTMQQSINEQKAKLLAELLKKFADKIDPYDPALQDLYKRNKELFDSLAEKLGIKGPDDPAFQNLSSKERQQLKNAKDKKDKAKKNLDDATSSNAAEQLESLKRNLETDAQETDKNGAKGHNIEGEDNPNDPIKSQGTQHQNQQQQNQQQQNQQQQNQQQQNQQQQNQQQQNQQQQNQQQQNQQQQNQQQQNQQQQNQQQQNQQQQNQQQQPEDQEQSALDSLKQQAENNSNQDTNEQIRKSLQEQMNSLRESVARSPSNDDPSNDNQDPKDQQIQDFMQRASQSDPQDMEVKPDPSSNSIDPSPIEGLKDTGDETSLNSKRLDHKVNLKEGKKGPSQSSVIKAASDSGFAKTSYKNVFSEYENIVDDVMDKEKVPSGYRYYVKKYFQLIQPK